MEAGGVAVLVDGATGSYRVQVDGADWLQGTPPTYLPGHPLALAGPAITGAGQDLLGPFDAVTLSWAAEGLGGGNAVLETRFASYVQVPFFHVNLQLPSLDVNENCE